MTKRLPSSMPQVCQSKPGGVRCTYPKLVMPGGGHSTMCYWHRLLRTSMDAQIRAAKLRLEAHASEPVKTRVPPAQWPDGERWCAGCQSFVPLFYARVSRCVACASQSARETRRMSVYGVTPAGFVKLDKLQDGRCAICRKRQRDRSIAIDHNHRTGDVRGLLCKGCNHDLLGAAYDSIKMLLAAAIYLAVPPADGGWIDPKEYGDVVLTAFLATVDELSRAERAERRAPRLERAASERIRTAERTGSRGAGSPPA